MIKKFEDFDSVNERQERWYMELKNHLEQAARAAERVGKDAKMNPGNYEGWEANEVSNLLEEIYAGIMTGDKKDDSRNDEIFK